MELSSKKTSKKTRRVKTIELENVSDKVVFQIYRALQDIKLQIPDLKIKILSNINSN